MNKLVVIAILCLASASSIVAQQPPPDLILTNGKIFTSNAAQPYVQALAIRGERITATGTTEEIKHLAGKNTRIIDLAGRTAIPGINDAHKHLSIEPPNSIEVDFKSFDPSWEDARQILAAALEKAPKGAFIFGDIGPKIFHTVSVDREALDKLSREHPIVLTTFTGHAGIVNSAALTAAGIAEEEPDPLGGRFEHSADGKLTAAFGQDLLKSQPPLWSAKPDIATFEKTENEGLAAAQHSIEAIGAVKGPHTVGNALTPYDEAIREIDSAKHLADLMQSVHPDHTFRDHATAMLTKANALSTDLSLDPKIYHSLASMEG